MYISENEWKRYGKCFSLVLNEYEWRGRHSIIINERVIKNGREYKEKVGLHKNISAANYIK